MSTTTPPPEGPDGPEYLEQGGGDPAPRSSADGSPGGGRRTALIAGGAVAALALVGAGAWAAVGFFASGSQPAEALPAGTLAYASVDLDPSGAQKIEAVRTLNKFPAIKDELGLDATDDLRRRIFEEAFDDCDAVSYADDVEPWLGTSFAVAAVEAGEEQPSPVVVMDLSDPGAAEDGLAALAGCDDDGGGWSVAGDWAVVAETDAIAQQVTDDAAEGTLADDGDYQEWMDLAGDPGVVSMYASPDAGGVLSQMTGPGIGMGGTQMPEEMTQRFEDFPGAAGAVRFDDGSLELEFVGGNTDNPVLDGDAEGVEVLTSLPEDTAVAFGLVFADGWGQKVLDQLSSLAGGGEMSPEDLLAQAEQMSGLSLPEDVETLFGDSMAIALGGDFSLEDLANSADGSDVPVGIKVQGDAAGIQDTLGTITGRLGPQAEQLLGNDAEGDTVAVGPSPDYRATLLGEGGLGDAEAFQSVVPEADRASMVLFANFQGDWLSSLVQGDQEVQDNLEPLGALGLSVWQDDDVSRGLLRITTD